jgi:tetratricopeptide (TPR) repeat protein
MLESFTEVLGHYVQRSHYSAPQVAALSGLPKRTVANWLGGVVLKPQQWQGIVKVAAALKLSETEASELLVAAGHASLRGLRQTAVSDDQILLSPWPPPTNIPFQAIANLPYFVGRNTSIQELEHILLTGQHVTICNLHGMGGVGKTSLAAHLAYRLRDRFPDGVLWARLDTTDTMTILSGFADAYGKDVSSYRDVGSRAAMVRDLLANKQTLVVLDNAENSEQVRPLLPPTTGKTAVLVTTRHDLAVADQMHRFAIESFDPDSGDALALFSYFLGQTVAEQWHTELQAIADLLGHLPLALAIAAGQLAYGRVPIPDFLSKLHQSEQRLDVLIREDRSVRLTFDLSYQALSTDMQHFFAALGTFGGDDFGIPAVSYITELADDEVQARLTKLNHLSLIQIASPFRYRLHPLLRDYAKERIESEHVYFRLAFFYIKLIEELDSTDYHSLMPETSNILALIQTTSERNMPLLLVKIVAEYHDFFYARGHLKYHRKNLALANQVASNMEEKIVLADILQKQGMIEVETGYYDKGVSYLLESLTLTKSMDPSKTMIQKVTCKTLKILGMSYHGRGDIQQARLYYEESLQIAEAIGYERDAILAINNLGGLSELAGNYHEAKSAYREATKRSLQFGSDYRLLINTFNSLSTMCISDGEYDQAIVYLYEGERLALLHGHETDRIRTLWLLATIRHLKGDVIGAQVYAQESLKIARKSDYLRSISFLLGELGKWSLQQGNYSQAISYLNEAISMARKLGITGRHFRILHYWGELCMAKEQWHEAVEVWNEVLEKAAEIIYIAAANYGLACVTKAQGDEDLAEQYTSTWQTSLIKMNDHQKRTFKQWLPNIPIGD